MNFLSLTDDAIFHIVELIREEPLLGLVAVVGLSRCQHRLRRLLAGEVDPTVLEQSSKVAFHWHLACFSSFRARPPETVIRSKTFSTPLGHSFRLMVFPNGNNVSKLSVYVEVEDAKRLPIAWTRDTKFTLRIHNHRDGVPDIIIQDVTVVYRDTLLDWGFRELFPLERAECDRWLSEDDVLHLSVVVTVEPPPLSFKSVKDVLTQREYHFQLVCDLLPLMITNLRRILIFNAEEPWRLRCSKCDEGFLQAIQMPKHCASKTRRHSNLGARVTCSTTGCKCAVVTAHAVLRSFVGQNCACSEAKWKRWLWPMESRPIRPEDFHQDSITTARFDYQRNHHSWRMVIKQFSADLDRCLAGH